MGFNQMGHLVKLNIRNKHQGENMKKRASCVKVKVLSKDCIFHVVIFISLYYIFHTIFQIEYQI
jgi:hypothetical protein